MTMRDRMRSTREAVGPKRWGWIGILLIPAFALAQPAPGGEWQNDQVLSAGDLNRLVQRVALLEERLFQAAKDRVVVQEGTPVSIDHEDLGNASASCPGSDDLLLHCGCQGRTSTGGNARSFNVRGIISSTNGGNASSCVCQGINDTQDSVVDAERFLVAIATCLSPIVAP